MPVLTTFKQAKLSFLFLVVTGLFCIPVVSGFGVFEIKIMSLGMDASHKPLCAVNPGTETQCKMDSSCSNATLVIDACLSHHQLHLPIPLQCTLGQTSITMPYHEVMVEELLRTKILQIPFSYSWPGGFTLSLTTRKQCPGRGGKGNVLSKAVLVDRITPSLQWTTFRNSKGSFRHSSLSSKPFGTLPPNSTSPMSAGRTKPNQENRRNVTVSTSKHASKGSSVAVKDRGTSVSQEPSAQTDNLQNQRSLVKRSSHTESQLLKPSDAKDISRHVNSDPISFKDPLRYEKREFYDQERSSLVPTSSSSDHNGNKLYSNVEKFDLMLNDESAEPQGGTDDQSSRHADVTEDPHFVKGNDVFVAVRIVCKQHYYGNSCSRLCKPRNDFLGHFQCTSSGDRSCLHGWRGKDCTEAVCSKRCALSKGKCIKPDTCMCKHGWYGESCDKCRTRLGCVHGTCQLPGQCICHRGWIGPLCDVEEKYCLDHKPCQNGGTCFHDAGHNYTCACLNGYTGAHCEVPMCHKHFCLHGGHCQIADGTRYCLCPSSFAGPRCQRHRPLPDHASKVGCTGAFCAGGVETSDFCEDRVCYNNGKCSLSPNSNTSVCICPSPFTGEQCLEVRNPCDNKPCLNNGVCTSTKDMLFNCKCPDGYSGQLCDTKTAGVHTNTDACDTKIVCQNDGKCKQSRRNGRYYCECSGNFTGEFCEISTKDPCKIHTCLNGGKCVLEHNNKPRCICKRGYTGILCQNLAEMCARVLCQHGGTCVEHDGEFMCICRKKFEGEFCEKKISVRKTVLSVSIVTAPRSSSSSTNLNLLKTFTVILYFISSLLHVVL